MKDEFVKQQVSNIMGIDQDKYWKDPDLFVKDGHLAISVLEELVLRDYNLEIMGTYPEYVVTATKWFMAGEDEEEDKYEYAYSRGNNLVKALMEVLIKVHRHD